MSLSRSHGLVIVAKLAARKLRKQQTPAEQVFWNTVRDRQFRGKKFLRQHPFLVDSGEKETFFIADFYCAEARLIVEIDGVIHEYHREDDILRERVLSERGLKIIRFSNNEVEQNIEHVLTTMEKEF